MSTQKAVPYVAAAMLCHAQQVDQEGIIRGDVETIAELASNAASMPVDGIVSAGALALLIEAGLATVADDDFAGEFYKINGGALNEFVALANQQSAQLTRDLIRDPTAEEEEDSYLKYFNHYFLSRNPVLGKFHDFGIEWLSKALDRLKNAPEVTGEPIPTDGVVRRLASQTVVLDKSSKAFTATVEQIDSLKKEIEENNEVGDLLGDNKIAIQAELSAAKAILEAGHVRTRPFLRLVSSTLRWLIEKTAGTIVAEAAKLLWKLVQGLMF